MKPKVYLIGVGMGNPDTLTLEAAGAIERCPILVGAPRLLEPYREGKTCSPLVASGDIFSFIQRQERGPVGVLLSGDVGFYSGAKNLWQLLEDYDVESLPGISSLVYFSSRLKTTWQDVHIVSAHGRPVNAAGEIQSHKKTFMLTGGKTKAQDVCRTLAEWGMEHVQVSVGENLSYPEERIVTGTPSQLSQEKFGDLAVLLCVNPEPAFRGLSNAGIPDENFIRGNTPMTKEEVRTVSLSKLRLYPSHTLWDVGAGTGSVSVECALSLPVGRVFAVEKDPEALELLEKNRAHFHTENLNIIPGEAPEALGELPPPDRVFIGGSSGGMEGILRAAIEKNSRVRVVVNAITLETLAETVRCFDQLGMEQTEVIQLAVNRSRRVGSYHMMYAQNPIWIISGEGKSCD